MLPLVAAAVGAVVCLFYASMKTSEARGTAQNAARNTEAEPESENTK
jgi:drug resistance transporter, emrB/qacA family